jgi:hypothetical protein
MPSLDDEIADYAAGVLLRYFRRAAAAPVGSPRIDVQRDREVLRSHWSMSAPVRSLASYLVAHPHETETLLTTRLRVDDAVVRGRIDARASILLRQRTGLATAVAAHEPIRSFDTGPNQLLAWVIKRADVLASRMEAWRTPESQYAVLAQGVLDLMGKIRRFEALRDALKSPLVQRRPSSGALRDSARSRRKIYRLARDAYDVLLALENGDDAAITEVVSSTLVGPLEPWRRFELAVAVGVGEALASATGQPLRLSILGTDPASPILTCGRYALFWQQTTKLYSTPAPEHSETVVNEILERYGLGTGADRPDLLLVDRTAGQAVSIVEVKYVSGDVAGTRFREAVEQVVRYSRGYENPAAVRRHSLIAMTGNPPTPVSELGDAPQAISFAAIKSGTLTAWAHAIAA